jgi:hypothetical protein
MSAFGFRESAGGSGGGGGGSGDVVGPASAGDDNIVTFDGTTGKLVQDSGIDITALVTASSTNTFTNKTFDADGTGNAISNIENADIKSGAAIAVNKLAALTASRAVVSDGSGFVSVATTTATEIGYVNGVTSAIQTQLNAKVSASKTYAVFTPLDNQAPSASFATLTTRNSIALLAFDDAANENAIFVNVLPEGANVASGLTVNIKWVAASATTGDVAWVVAFMAMDATTDIDSDSFDTTATATTTTLGTAGFTATTSITITTIDSLVAGVAYRLKVTRDTAVGGNMTGDAQISGVEVRSAA